MIEISVDRLQRGEYLEKFLTPKEKQVIKEKLKNECCEKLKKVLENNVTVSEGYEEIKDAATEIINDIFSREELIDHAYDVQQRDESLFEHGMDVAIFSILIALKMNLSKWEVYDIGIGSLMHDMGLRYLSVDYKDVDLDSFTKEQYFEYKKHTLYGFSSVEKETWISNEAKKIILYHHERLDGSGYPFKQKVTPLSVRIVAIVDAFYDMLNGIGCKRKNIRETVDYIRNGRDIYFESRVVDYFLGFIAAYPIGTIVVTNRGDKAVVIEQNQHSTDRPKLKLICDRDNNPYNNKVCDLITEMSVYIERVKEQ